VRVVNVYPNSIKIFQNHADDLDEAMPITKLELSHCQKFAASISHDNAIKFYDLSDILNIKENAEEVEIIAEKTNNGGTLEEDTN